MFNFKNLCFILLLLFLTLGVSCVCASEVDNVTVSNFNDDTLVIDNNFSNITSDQNNESPISYPNNFDANQINNGNIYYKPGSFDDLYNEIHSLNSGDTYVFDKDYVFDGSIHYYGGILIGLDNITINGDGHIIDGKNLAAIFTVKGNNVKIFNLTVVNSHQFDMARIHITPKGSWAYCDINSAITWYGNNGVISDCKFKENCAINGGAISWKGNNGLIDNCVFINNIARGVGGAIYIAGENNIISNSAFINSTSKLSGEAIFIDRNHKNIKIENSNFTGLSYRNGQNINFNVTKLHYSIITSIIDGKYTIIEMIYRSILFNESIIAIDQNIRYCGTLNNNEFVLTYTKYFGDGLILTKQYYFSNITSCDDIINAILNNLYAVKYIFVKHVDVYGTIVGPVIGDGSKWYSYDEARTMSAVAAFSPLCQYILNDTDFNPALWVNIILGLKSDKIQTVLDVNFARTLNIFSRQTWRANGFNTVIINGNNSYINAAVSDDDEFTWAEIAKESTFIISNLTIAHYNRGIYNYGACILNNVHFDNNKMNYWYAEDYGAAINNKGLCICNNCSFTNNYAKFGGAIFNMGILYLDNCSFSGNIAYNLGNDVLNVGNGIVYYDGIKIDKCHYGPIHYTGTVRSSCYDLILILSSLGIVLTVAIIGLTAGVLAIKTGGMIIPVIVAVLGSIGAISGGIFSFVFFTRDFCKRTENIDVSKIENYTPTVIDINTYTKNYEGEVINAVSF